MRRAIDGTFPVQSPPISTDMFVMCVSVEPWHLQKVFATENTMYRDDKIDRTFSGF
jgi:hypothetical protein